MELPLITKYVAKDLFLVEIFYSDWASKGLSGGYTSLVQACLVRPKRLSAH